MMKYIKRLAYRTDNEMLNPLMHLFLFITFCFSVAFVFFGDTTSAQAIVLYTESLRVIGGGSYVINIWGVVGMAVTLGNTILLMMRDKAMWLAEPITLGGMFLWLYAGTIYFSSGYILQLLVAALPNFLFWCWYYVRILRYKREKPRPPS